MNRCFQHLVNANNLLFCRAKRDLSYMAKYRLLTKEELESMRDDFVKYLIINGMDVDEWLRLKKEEPSKADKVIELFSDVVFEKVLRQVEYLDVYTTHSIKAFKCGADEMSLIALETEDDAYDFTTAAGVAKAKTNPPADLKIYTTTKAYSEVREMEIYLMTVGGAVMSKGHLYKSLEPLLA